MTINRESLSRGDLIDFPCSPDWISHYARLGLTPDYPPEYYATDTSRLRQRIEELEEEVRNLRAELEGRKVIHRYVHITGDNSHSRQRGKGFKRLVKLATIAVAKG